MSNLQLGDFMLKIANTIRQLDYTQLLQVYSEQLQGCGVYGSESEFYEDLTSFLFDPDRFCCLWVCDGRYAACVRVEPYRNGILMTCLETAPERRRKGIAQALLSSVFELLRQQGCRFVYVHINKKNRPSLALHNKLGFRVIADSARLADGTVSQKFFTMKSDI